MVLMQSSIHPHMGVAREPLHKHSWGVCYTPCGFVTDAIVQSGTTLHHKALDTRLDQALFRRHGPSDG